MLSVTTKSCLNLPSCIDGYLVQSYERLLMRIASYLSVIFHGAQCHDGIILELQLNLVP